MLKKITTITVFISLLFGFQMPLLAFSDLGANHPNRIAILYLQKNGVVGGYDDGTFRPDSAINRAELMKMLVEGLGISPSRVEYRNCFTDVFGDWYARYVCYAAEQGWVDGYPDGSFGPARLVNDVEAVKMILNAQGISIAQVTEAPFGDTPVGAWFTPFVATAKTRNVLPETGDLYRPGKEMTRGGIGEILFRSIALQEAGVERFETSLIAEIFDTPMGEEPEETTSETEEEETETTTQSGSTTETEEAGEGEEEETALPPRVQTADLSQSSIGFTAGRNNTPIHEGDFEDFTLTLTRDADDRRNLTKAKIDVEIQIGSLKTDNGALTSHLLTNEFFSQSVFGTATFRSASIVAENEQFRVTGDLTIRNQTKFISFLADITDTNLSMEFSLGRLDFTVGSQDDGIDTVIPVTADITFEK